MLRGGITLALLSGGVKLLVGVMMLNLYLQPSIYLFSVYNTLDIINHALGRIIKE